MPCSEYSLKAEAIIAEAQAKAAEIIKSAKSETEKMESAKIDFGMPASSNSNYFTSNYEGKIFLLEYSDAEAKLYFDNLTFSLPDGDYVLDGKLTFSIKYE